MIARRTLLGGAMSLAMPALAQPASVLRIVPQSNLAVLDPIWTSSLVTANHGYAIFDTLYAAASDGRSRPQMAEGHEVSDDGRVWRIRLRDGLRFHDGTPVLARDCTASLRRWAAKDPFGQLLAPRVERWDEIDDRTIELRLTRPFPPLLDALGKPSSAIPFIMPQRLAATDPNTALKEMVGSGPYRFLPDDWVPGASAAYARHDGYVPRIEPPDWASGGKIAHFDRVEWHILPDAATAEAALRQGEVDWWEAPLDDLIPQLVADRNIAVQAADPSGLLGVARMNHLQPPFDNRLVRQAVWLAVDQQEIMQATIGDDSGLWRECASLFPCSTTIPKRADMNGARRLLARSGYFGQRAVVLNVVDVPTIAAMGRVLSDQMRRLGINVELVEADFGTVVQRRTSREPVERGGWSLFCTRWPTASIPDPAQNTIVRGQGARGWFGWWQSARAEELAATWLDAPDGATRDILQQDIDRLALEDVATMPLGQFVLRTAYRRSLSGILPGPGLYPWNVRRI